MSMTPKTPRPGQVPTGETPTELARPRGVDHEPSDVPTPAQHAQDAEDVQVFRELPPGGGGSGGGNGGGTHGDDQPRGTSARPFVVALTRPDDPALEHYEVALWDVISATSKAMSFSVYSDYLDAFFEKTTDHDGDNAYWDRKRNSAIRRPVSSYGMDSWDLVTTATDIFVKHQAGALGDVEHTAEQIGSGGLSAMLPNREKRRTEHVLVDQIGRNPNLSSYLEMVRRKLSDLPTIEDFSISSRRPGIARERVESPLLVELIWSYWMEQGMLVQTVNAVALRFQNTAAPELVNTLRNLATDPLRPLSNLLWAFVQTQGNRLPIARRLQEYLGAYGLDLVGKAVPQLRVVESRSRFLEAFHRLIAQTLAFYKEHDDLTVKADGFPLLHGLTEVHTLLAEGAHNQFNDMPWTARSEMMSMQWLLARPEFREFLGGRIMVPYPEPWMDRVDTMKSLQGWTDTSVTAFYWLATYSEQILLSIRYGNWSMITDGALASKWAERFRYAVQSYAQYLWQATALDLTVPVTDARDAAWRFRQPSLLIAERSAQTRAVAGPARTPRAAPAIAAPDAGLSVPGRRRPALPAPRGV